MRIGQKHEHDIGSGPRRSRRYRPGAAAMFAGAPLIVVATMLFLAGSDIAPLIGVSETMVLIACVVVGGSGIALLVFGLARKFRAQRLATDPPEDYWRYDHSWNPRELVSEDYRRLGTALRWLAVALPIEGLLVYGAIVKGGGLLLVLPGLVGVIVLAIVLRLGHLLLRLGKFGRNRIELARFPFFLGESMDVVLSCPARVKNAERIDVQLRCIEEYWYSSSRGSDSTSVRFALLHEDSVELRPASQIELSFPLPHRDELSTRLSCVGGGQLPRYWELEVTAEMPGIDFSAAFLLPVYARRFVGSR